MNPSTVPAFCSLTLTAVFSAGISHWWSVRQFADLLEHGMPMAPAPATIPQADVQPAPILAKTPSKHTPVQAAIVASGSKSQQEFFEALIEKINRLDAQNRDLHDQLAETNRDMMNMEFRLDSHSASFRPLPAVEDKPFGRINQDDDIDSNPGVLPPRAEPINLPSYE